MRAIRDFFVDLPEKPQYIFLLFTIILILIPSIQIITSQTVRRSFVFENNYTGRPVLEERAIARLKGREENIGLYISEYLLGPSKLDALELFPTGTSLNTLMLRKNTLWVDLSEKAEMPVQGMLDIRPSLAHLKKGLKMNFPFVKDIRLTISGVLPYTGKVKVKK